MFAINQTNTSVCLSVEVCVCLCVCVYWLVWTRTLHWEQLMRRLVPSSPRWGVADCSSSMVVVVKHISGMRGLVRIRPPAAMTGLSELFAHSVWEQPERTDKAYKQLWNDPGVIQTFRFPGCWMFSDVSWCKQRISKGFISATRRR